MTSDGVLLVDVDDRGIASVTLNRPNKRNALSAPLILELRTAFAALSAQPTIQLIVLSGNGPAFCAGADIEHMRDMASASASENRADAEQLALLLHEIDHCPHPLLCVIHGHAYGGALGLIACADIVLADVATQCCFSEVRLGIIPATICPYVLRKMGYSHALSRTISADTFDGALAATIGLVHYAVTADQLDATKMRLIELISQHSSGAMRMIKHCINALDPITPAVVDTTQQWLAHSRNQPDAAEGLAAFLEKRSPHWQE